MPGGAGHDLRRCWRRCTTTSAQLSSSSPLTTRSVGAPQLDHEARADLEVVRVLGAARERLHLHQIAAHRLGERLEIGDGRDDAELVAPPRPAHGPRTARRAEDRSAGDQARHGSRMARIAAMRMAGLGLHQNGCAGWAPEDEGGLEEQLVHDPGARAVVAEADAVRALGVLVGEAEAQELRRQNATYGSTAHSRPGSTGYCVQS